MISSFRIDYSYPIVFTRDAFAQDNTELSKAVGANQAAKAIFLVEDTVAALFPSLCAQIKEYANKYKDSIRMPVQPSVLEGGEAHKNMEQVMRTCAILSAAGLCRQSSVIMVGGGAFLDTCGLAAAMFHRGLRQIRIPTTALSQCDSSVGVKNAVNALGFKNLLGVFAPPSAVLVDSLFLSTMSPLQLSSAAAEAIKVAMIKDSGFFQFLAANSQEIMVSRGNKLEQMVRRAAEIHATHICSNGDPFETGNARPLDFGHWAAHKIEMLSNGEMPHGIAVGMGLLIDTEYAVSAGLAPQATLDALRSILMAFQLPFHKRYLAIMGANGHPAILDGIDDFREHIGGALNITFATTIGQKTEQASIDMAAMENTIRKLAE